MVNDPIADMLTRIRNAKAVAHNTVTIPFSNLKLKLAEILEKEGIIGKVTTQGKKTKKSIEIELKYKKGKSMIDTIKKISSSFRCALY